MKKTFALAAVCFVIGTLLSQARYVCSAGPNEGTTRPRDDKKMFPGQIAILNVNAEQRITMDVLQKLKFQGVLRGNPPVDEYEVTDETIKYLKQLQSDGKKFLIGQDGAITFKAEKQDPAKKSEQTK